MKLKNVVTFNKKTNITTNRAVFVFLNQYNKKKKKKNVVTFNKNQYICPIC